uniref:DUF4776 domain-containing protein n=1 Tax=Bracon brevicornis TaxID=1563983 RepID=A0A6V7IN19_9HYME
MGWLWNTSRIPGSVKPRIGWRPGAISKGVWKIFEKSKTARDLEDIEERRILPAVKGNFLHTGILTFSLVKPQSLMVIFLNFLNLLRLKGKKGKMAKSKSLLSLARSQKKRRERDEGSELPPTLHLHRKNGDYYITMHPVNPENSPEIQAEVKPLQFKVARNRNGNDDSADSSSVGDDMEIEYSPPTAIHRLEKKAERRDLEIQVVQNDIIEAFKGSGGGAAGPKKKKKGGKK